MFTGKAFESVHSAGHAFRAGLIGLHRVGLLYLPGSIVSRHAATVALFLPPSTGGQHSGPAYGGLPDEHRFPTFIWSGSRAVSSQPGRKICLREGPASAAENAPVLSAIISILHYISHLFCITARAARRRAPRAGKCREEDVKYSCEGIT